MVKNNSSPSLIEMVWSDGYDEIKILPLDQQKVKLEKAILDWKGDQEQTDDISFAGIRF